MAITFAAPRIGLANAVFFVLLGQLLMAAAIDHFALLGVDPHWPDRAACLWPGVNGGRAVFRAATAVMRRVLARG